jgi:hypothetical protein
MTMMELLHQREMEDTFSTLSNSGDTHFMYTQTRGACFASHNRGCDNARRCTVRNNKEPKKMKTKNETS